MRRFLIVANRTLGGRALHDAVRERVEAGACSFHVLVPASHDPREGTWDEDQTRAQAQERLARMLAALTELGCEADGEVGDYRPVDAALDALRSDDYDEIILSTLPPGVSRWLKMDLVSRVERAVSVPVTHVVSEPAAAEAG